MVREPARARQPVISLRKVIMPGDWRWIGQRVQGFSTLDFPIGADCSDSVIERTNGRIYRAGDIPLTKAFVIERPPFRLLYVCPHYGGYRTAADNVFRDCSWKIDYDHALGKKLARTLGYRYVLLIRLTPTANRSHGSYEKVPAPSLERGKLCFADRRIIDKWIGRRPTHMHCKDEIADYDAGIAQAFDLTLKQAGKWGYAMGVEDRSITPKRLRAA